jgi:hypothetical protein
MVTVVRIPVNCNGSSLNKGASRAPVVTALLFGHTLAWLSQAR